MSEAVVIKESLLRYKANYICFNDFSQKALLNILDVSFFVHVNIEERPGIFIDIEAIRHGYILFRRRNITHPQVRCLFDDRRRSLYVF